MSSKIAGPRPKEGRTGQWIAVVAAIIAAAAAMVSSVVASNTAVSTTRTQSHAVAVQAERQEKRESYSSYISAAMGLHHASFLIYDLTREFAPDIGQLRIVIDNDFKDAFEKLLLVEGSVSIVASASVDSARSEFVSVANRMEKLVDLQIRPLLGDGNNANPTKLVGLSNDYYNDFAQFGSSLKRLIDAARADLNDLGFGE